MISKIGANVAKTCNVPFGRVNYTNSGKAFMEKQPQFVRDVLASAEEKMKNNKYAHLVVDKDGYSVKLKEKDELCFYKVTDVIPYLGDKIMYAVSGKNTDYFTFDFSQNPLKKELLSSRAKMKSLNWLFASIDLVNLLEDRYKDLVDKKRGLFF